MSEMSMTRSQMILRMPVENVNATVILHDGERAEVMLFVAGGEDVSGVVTDPRPFVPMVKGGRVCLIARPAIAALSVASQHAGGASDDDLPMVRQKAAIKLRCGVVLEGELVWVNETGRRRTTDYLNHDTPYLVLRAGDVTYFVVKEQVAMVTEQ